MKQTTNAILTGGTIVDGTGAPSISGEVVIRDGRIVSVGSQQSNSLAAERCGVQRN